MVKMIYILFVMLLKCELIKEKMFEIAREINLEILANTLCEELKTYNTTIKWVYTMTNESEVAHKIFGNWFDKAKLENLIKKELIRKLGSKGKICTFKTSSSTAFVVYAKEKETKCNFSCIIKYQRGSKKKEQIKDALIYTLFISLLNDILIPLFIKTVSKTVLT